MATRSFGLHESLKDIFDLGGPYVELLSQVVVRCKVFTRGIYCVPVDLGGAPEQNGTCLCPDLLYDPCPRELHTLMLALKLSTCLDKANVVIMYLPTIAASTLSREPILLHLQTAHPSLPHDLYRIWCSCYHPGRPLLVP